MQQTNFTGWIDQQIETAPVINVYTDITPPHDIATLTLANGDLLIMQVEFEVDSTVAAAPANVLAKLFIGGSLMAAFALPETIAAAAGKYALLFMLQTTPDTVQQTRIKTSAWVDGIAYETLDDTPNASGKSGGMKLQLRVNQLNVGINVFQSIITRVRAGLT